MSLLAPASREPQPMSMRLTRFRALLAAAGLDGAVVRRPENVFYLTGVAAGTRPSFAVVGPQRAVVVAPVQGATPAADVELIGYETPGPVIDRVVDVDLLSAAALRAAVDRAELRDVRIGVEDAAIAVLHHADLARRAAVVPMRGEVEALRRRKDADELPLIRDAIRCNEIGLAAAQRTIGPDVSEFELFLAVAQAIQEAASVPVDLGEDNNAFISGPRTASIAGPATARRLMPGDLMIIDVNPVIRHYKGDLTRTFCVGQPTRQQRAMHDALVRAHDHAMPVGRAGATARDVDAALRQTLVDAGFGKWLFGHMGHGLGLQHTERPYIIPAEEMQLDEQMVIALEPGIYVPGELGMRLEENYIVTARGLEPLNHFPRELIACG